MFCTGKGAIPIVFQSMFKRVTHPYYTLFRKSKFRETVTFVGHKFTSICGVLHLCLVCPVVQ